MAKEKSLDDLRAQRDALDRQLAEASLEPARALATLLASQEVADLMTAITTAATPLDEANRQRIGQWVAMHAALAKLGQMEVTRLEKLIETEAPVHGG